MTESREFQDGELIAGTRYRVVRLIGVGGMGSVYEVEHIELGKRFVLKALLRELARREDLAQRLRNEWRALARLQHANIVNVTDAGTSQGGVPYYVMERLDGDTLAGVLRQKRRLHVLEAVNVTASVLDALSAAHDIGVIHRDVKPANVFIVNGGAVKLLDFGIAKIADVTSVVTARGLAVGTPRYMSPEQARGERVDGRSDIYAAALMLFEMIAGVGPFDDCRDANELLLAHLAREAPLLSSLVMGVSPELERIVARMLAKDLRERPTHARDGAALLREFVARQRSLPATDDPTVRAAYPIDAAARRVTPSPIHDSVTRPEGGAASSPSLSDIALTQRMSVPGETTQVTVSVNTSEAFSVSSVPNTTFVSPPSFAGVGNLGPGGTLEMSSPGQPQQRGGIVTRSFGSPHAFPPVEHPERTEMLGDYAPPLLGDAIETRTRVPLPEMQRPASLTPPPVVDTGRIEGAATLRPLRWMAAGAGGLAAVGLLVFLVFRAARPSEVPAAGAAAQPVVVPVAAPRPPTAVPPAAVPSAEQVASAPASQPAAASAPPPETDALRKLPNVPDSKKLVTASAANREAPSGAFLRKVPTVAPPAPPPAPRQDSKMPGSGL